MFIFVRHYSKFFGNKKKRKIFGRIKRIISYTIYEFVIILGLVVTIGINIALVCLEKNSIIIESVISYKEAFSIILAVFSLIAMVVIAFQQHKLQKNDMKRNKRDRISDLALNYLHLERECLLHFKEQEEQEAKAEIEISIPFQNVAFEHYFEVSGYNVSQNDKSKEYETHVSKKGQALIVCVKFYSDEILNNLLSSIYESLTSFINRYLSFEIKCPIKIDCVQPGLEEESENYSFIIDFIFDFIVTKQITKEKELLILCNYKEEFNNG